MPVKVYAIVFGLFLGVCIWKFGNPVILDHVQDILGPNFICWGSHFFCKLAHDPRKVAWHQDAAYWPLTPARTVTVWLAIDDADRGNAAMKFLPGTHRQGHLKWREVAKDQAVLNQEIENTAQMGEPVYDVLRAGQFSLHADMLAFIAWSSLAAPLPLFLSSAWFEGPSALAALAHPSARLIVSLAVLAYGGTTFGYGMWSRLLARHSAAAVAPFALLVPIVGMAAGVVVFGEPLDAFEVWGAILVMAGLSVNVFGDRLLVRRLGVVG